jgi:hypothetical protein
MGNTIVQWIALDFSAMLDPVSARGSPGARLMSVPACPSMIEFPRNLSRYVLAGST